MNVTEPLSAEFDGILSQRTRFNTEINKWLPLLILIRLNNEYIDWQNNN
jgi:hypothetical protein